MPPYETILLTLLIAHLLCCGLLWLGIRLRILRVRRTLLPVALLLPATGPLLLLILHLQDLFGQTGRSEIGVEKFQVESELYRPILQEGSRASGSTVSMEEALIVNTPRERRALIMDILNDNPKAYVDFLKLAGNNADTEVVHYAVTAMVQISKENDQLLWEFERQYAQNPDDLTLLTPYCDFLWHCLEQGLMQGQVERMNRSLFDRLVQRKLRLGEPILTDYLRCIENCLLMKNYPQANAMLETARAIWPHNEELLILKLQYSADMNRPEDIKALVEELRVSDVYLSAKAKEVIAFWSD